MVVSQKLNENPAMIAGLSMLADMPKFGEFYIINTTFIGSEEASSFG